MGFRTELEKRFYQRGWVAARRFFFLEGKSCLKCGTTKNLEFDHIDPRSKTSHRIWSRNREFIEKELKKCQILCTNCHLQKTLSTHVPSIYAYTLGCRCSGCRSLKREKDIKYRSRSSMVKHRTVTAKSRVRSSSGPPTKRRKA